MERWHLCNFYGAHNSIRRHQSARSIISYMEIFWAARARHVSSTLLLWGYNCDGWTLHISPTPHRHSASRSSFYQFQTARISCCLHILFPFNGRSTATHGSHSQTATVLKIKQPYLCDHLYLLKNFPFNLCWARINWLKIARSVHFKSPSLFILLFLSWMIVRLGPYIDEWQSHFKNAYTATAGARCARARKTRIGKLKWFFLFHRFRPFPCSFLFLWQWTVTKVNLNV